MATGREVVRRYNGIIVFFTTVLSIFPLSFHKWNLKLFRGTKGKIGMLIRYVILKNICPSIGENVSIHENVILLRPEKLQMGSNVSIHPNCYIDALGGVKMADNVSVATSCILISFNHTWVDDSTPIKYNPVAKNPITIDSDVWLGAAVKVIGPCCIGSRCIVAAGAVVKGNIKTHSVVAGVPARIIKSI